MHVTKDILRGQRGKVILQYHSGERGEPGTVRMFVDRGARQPHDGPPPLRVVPAYKIAPGWPNSKPEFRPEREPDRLP